jgi:hypothetical protein
MSRVNDIYDGWVVREGKILLDNFLHQERLLDVIISSSPRPGVKLKKSGVAERRLPKCYGN